MTGVPVRQIQDHFYDSVLREKYAKGDESSADEVFTRVARGLAEAELAHALTLTPARLRQLAQSQRQAIGPAFGPEDYARQWAARFHAAMTAGFYPAGRIMSAAGSGLQATMINCFVQPVGDSINEPVDGRPGIFSALAQAAETMRRGGGVGYDFSPIRPLGAAVQRTRSRASGPVSYMRIFDRMCETVESAGARRGAQMGILRCDHPDIELFVQAKDIRVLARRLREAGIAEAELESLLQQLRTLANFNISVAVTDAFIAAVQADADFELVHRAEPDRGQFPQARRRDDGTWVYRSVRARELWDRIMETTYATADPGVVFIDRINADNNLAYAETLSATNPCAEQPLPDYGCCCLGSINLARFVVDPFGAAPAFRWERLREITRDAVRMLDDVLDVTYWPLPEQRDEAMAKRRIGLGFTGLGTALAMLKLRYGSDEGNAFAREVSRALRDEAYRASIGLAQERGAFPRFDAQAYLAGAFTRRLPDDVRDAIRAHGIRNSHLLSIAPTGTISLAFGRNVTGGIEPAFSWVYTRSKREAGGERVQWPVEDYAYRMFREQGGDVANLPEYFASAQTLSALDHLKIQAAVQPYVDSSISKTINVPVDYPFADFKDLYLKAWEWGCKGCTTYRPNDVTGAVLSVTAAPQRQQPSLQFGDGDPDRRIRLARVPAPVLGSLKWPGRPQFAGGNPAWTYMVETHAHKFAVFIGHLEDGGKYPFEVWVNGAEQPRGLGATAKLLSMDMRSNDRSWLRWKLEALQKTSGDPITLAMPPEGRPVTLGSPTAALSRLVLFRCQQLGAFEPAGPTPVLDALMSEAEPRTGPDGTMSWTADIANPATGDDFAIVLKELVMPDGQRRPYAVGLAGHYPRDFDGLCRLLSLDMRVVDPAWVGAKLSKLLSYGEAAGEFLAQVPGEKKGQLWPSTVAYMAALMLHRYAMLGILDREGKPLRHMGVLEPPAVAPGRGAPVLGELCPDCAAHAVIKRDGCRTCTSCGWIGNCG